MIVVAGGSGRTGTRIARGPLTAGHEVRVLLRSERARAKWLAQGAEVAMLTLEDATALRAALAGADAFYALVPEDSRAPDFRAGRASHDSGHGDLSRRPCGALVCPGGLVVGRERTCRGAGRSEVIDLVGSCYTPAQAAAALGALLGKSLHVAAVPANAQVATLMGAGSSMDFARALAELYACLPHVVPRGDRMVAGTIPLEQTLREALRSAP